MKNFSKLFIFLSILSVVFYLNGCDDDCEDTTVILRVVGYSTDMCPEPMKGSIDGIFRREMTNGNSHGSGYSNGSIFPMTKTYKGSGWTKGGTFVVTQEGRGIDIDGTPGKYYKCSSGTIVVPPVKCGETRIVDVILFCVCY